MMNLTPSIRDAIRALWSVTSIVLLFSGGVMLLKLYSVLQDSDHDALYLAGCFLVLGTVAYRHSNLIHQNRTELVRWLDSLVPLVIILQFDLGLLALTNTHAGIKELFMIFNTDGSLATVTTHVKHVAIAMPLLVAILYGGDRALCVLHHNLALRLIAPGLLTFFTALSSAGFVVEAFKTKNPLLPLLISLLVLTGMITYYCFLQLSVRRAIKRAAETSQQKHAE